MTKIKPNDPLRTEFEREADKVGYYKRKSVYDAFVENINKYVAHGQVSKSLSDITKSNLMMTKSDQDRTLAYYLYDHSKEIFGVDNYDTIQKRKNS